LDLLECAVCDRRFLVPHAAEGQAWACPGGDHELKLVVRGLPGTPTQIEAALNAVRLDAEASADAGEPAEEGLAKPGYAGQRAPDQAGQGRREPE
jgi:hypothetical protein